MDISKEVAALESLFDKQMNHYYDTPVLQGKKWYGLGLEDNESSNNKDNGAKKGIIRRMIDAVIAFINRMIAKIKEFFSKKKDVDTEKVFKEYNGPTDESTAQSFADFARDYAKKEEQNNQEMAAHTAKMKAEMAKDAEEHKRAMASMAKDTEKLKAMTEKMRKEAADVASRLAKAREAREKLEKSLNEVAKETGKVPSAEEVKEIAAAQMVDKFFENFRYQHTTWFVMTLSDEFVKSYNIVEKAYDDLTGSIKKGEQPDVQIVDALHTSIEDCRKLQEKHRLTPKEKMVDIVTKVVNGDKSLHDYAGTYLHDSSRRISEADEAYKKAKAKLESIADSAPPEEVTVYRNAMFALGQYWVLYGNISDWSHFAAKILAGGK